MKRKKGGSLSPELLTSSLSTSRQETFPNSQQKRNKRRRRNKVKGFSSWFGCSFRAKREGIWEACGKCSSAYCFVQRQARNSHTTVWGSAMPAGAWQSSVSSTQLRMMPWCYPTPGHVGRAPEACQTVRNESAAQHRDSLMEAVPAGPSTESWAVSGKRACISSCVGRSKQINISVGSNRGYRQETFEVSLEGKK